MDRSRLRVAAPKGASPPNLFPAGSYSVAKSCAAKPHFITETFSPVNAFFSRIRRRSASGAARPSGSVFITNGFPSVNGFMISFFQCRGLGTRTLRGGFLVDPVDPMDFVDPMDIAAFTIDKKGDAFASPP